MSAPKPPLDRHAPRALTYHRGEHLADDPATRLREQYELDEIELACPGCIVQWRGGGWQHDSGCVLRGVPLRRGLA